MKSSPPSCLHTILTYLFISIISVVHAVPTINKSSDSYGVNGYTVSGTVLAIILLIAGVILTFFGRKFIKARITLFIIGTFIFANFIYILMGNYLPADTANRQAIIIGVSLGIGILGGLILVFFHAIGMMAIGALGGYALALFILSFKSGTLLTGVGRIIFIIAMVVLGIILVRFFEKWVIIIATAFIGAYAIFIGIDFFANTGFNNALKDILTGSITYQVTPKVIGMMIGTIALAIVGIIVQLVFP